MSDSCWEDREIDPKSRQPLTWRDLVGDPLRHEVARYTVFASYFAKGPRRKTRIVARSLTWEEANILRDRLQDRVIRRAGIHWSSFVGRLYSLELEQKGCFHHTIRTLKEILRGGRPDLVGPAYRDALAATSKETILEWLTPEEQNRLQSAAA